MLCFNDDLVAVFDTLIVYSRYKAKMEVTRLTRVFMMHSLAKSMRSP